MILRFLECHKILVHTSNIVIGIVNMYTYQQLHIRICYWREFNGYVMGAACQTKSTIWIYVGVIYHLTGANSIKFSTRHTKYQLLLQVQSHWVRTNTIFLFACLKARNTEFMMLKILWQSCLTIKTSDQKSYQRNQIRARQNRTKWTEKIKHPERVAYVCRSSWVVSFIIQKILQGCRKWTKTKTSTERLVCTLLEM